MECRFMAIHIYRKSKIRNPLVNGKPASFFFTHSVCLRHRKAALDLMPNNINYKYKHSHNGLKPGILKGWNRLKFCSKK